MTKFWMAAAAVAVLCVANGFAQAPVAVLNAMQLPIEDLDLGMDATPAAVQEAAPVAGDPLPEADVPADEPAAAPAFDLGGLLEEVPAVEVPVPEVGVPAEEPVEPAAAPEAAPAFDLGGLIRESAPVEAPVDEDAPEADIVTEAPAVAAVESEPFVEPVVASAPAGTDPVAVIVSEMEALERVRREAQDRHGFGALKQGQAAMARGSYEEAIKLFQEASDYIGDRPSNAIPRREADDGIKEAYYRHALLLQRRDNLEDAYKAAIAARRAGHPKGEELALALDKLIKNPPLPPPPKVEKRWNEPTYRETRERSQRLMNRAREFYATGEYDQCRSTLELIMRDNPFHTEAITMLQKLGTRRFDVADQEFEATRREMIHEVKSVWTPRNYAKDLTDIGGGGGIGTGTNTPTTEVVMIQEKMRKIIIPEINFRQANLTDVITFLGDASREYDDPNTAADQRGINFILSLQAPGSPRSTTTSMPSQADPFAAPLDPLAAAPMSGAGTPITFQARYVTLYDALSIVMNLADLKFRIRGNVVIVMPSNFPDSELIHRMYNVLPTLVDRMVTFKQDRTGGGGVGDPFGMQAATIDQQSDWKSFFRDLGVNWPEGSSIQHMPTIGKLVVMNTSENLSTLETVLAVLNVTPRQVEIEARFVEVMQSDLESMGFEWILNNNWQMLENKQDAGLPLEARRRIVMQRGNFNSGFDYLNQTGVGGNTPVADTLLTVSSVLTNPELSMVLHMLSQRKSTDLLSAPKVVTKNGSEATIKVITEYIYPTEFTTDPATFSDFGVLQTPPVTTPGAFETREVGVILQVVPDVTPDGQMINLTLAPQVVSEPIWKNYGSTYTDADGQLQNINMEQPFFPVRSISTSIQIYNGATVVMGGMITEIRQTNEDKTPILGDLPVIGRLFRYKYESSEKRNLLIFVTAKLVDPAGRVVRDRQDMPMLPLAGIQ